MEVAQAFQLISRAIDAGRAAHGYLVVGDLKGGCDELTGLILAKLLPDAGDARQHPDVAWLEPSGAKRLITVQDMRERIVEPISVTSYSGGWKVGVVVGADRMGESAANAFLKSLEEPPPRTLFLLLTDQPDAILPTIVSRSQRIDLPLSDGLFEGEALDALRAALAARDAAALAEVLADAEDEVDDADVQLVRKRFFKTLMDVARRLMTGGRLPRHLAFRNVEAVEDAYRRVTERSMNAEAVLSLMLDLFTFPERREP